MVRLSLTVRKNLLPGLAGRVRAGVRTGLERSREPLHEDLKRRTPVDTGDLRGSETVTVEGESLRLTAGRGLPDGRAVYVHQGTRRMAPRPYMADAMEQGAPRVAAAVSDAVREAVG